MDAGSGNSARVTPAQARELAEKQERIAQILREHNLAGLVLARNENIAWATAGLVDLRVGMHRETGPGRLLFTPDGGRFYLTTDNEAERVAAEEFEGLDFQPLLEPWYASDPERSIRAVVRDGRIAGDVPLARESPLALSPFRSELTEGEVERYRWLGRQAADAASAVALSLEPGISEREIQARLAGELIRRGLTPSVYLCAVDERILRYRHAVPRDGMLQRFAMIGFCARYTGLAVSITRFVHFGALPQDLATRFAAMSRVAARLLAATLPGATADRLFSVAEQAFADEGFATGERQHHQGGATGYNEREWVARPAGTEQVLRRQAFAWNPNLRGAKVEDTVLHHEGAIELLTSTPELPVLRSEWEGRVFELAGVLLR